jgi:hypothetical protein
MIPANESSQPEKLLLFDLNQIQELELVPHNHQRLLATALQMTGRIGEWRKVRLRSSKADDGGHLDPNLLTDASNVQS